VDHGAFLENLPRYGEVGQKSESPYAVDSSWRSYVQKAIGTAHLVFVDKASEKNSLQCKEHSEKFR
jgi:hypothetical protein